MTCMYSRLQSIQAPSLFVYLKQIKMALLHTVTQFIKNQKYKVFRPLFQELVEASFAAVTCQSLLGIASHTWISTWRILSSSVTLSDWTESVYNLPFQVSPNFLWGIKMCHYVKKMQPFSFLKRQSAFNATETATTGALSKQHSIMWKESWIWFSSF